MYIKGNEHFKAIIFSIAKVIGGEMGERKR